jgi:hypothetical protein
VIILYSNRTGRLPPILTVGPRQQQPPPPPMYTLGGSRQPTFQLPATDIPLSSTPPLFQTQPSALDTGTEDQLAWDEIQYDDILASMQDEELVASQLTQPPPVLIGRHSWRPAERPQAAERHRSADRRWMLEARRRRRHRLPTS